jgi:NADH-quinone oxidoreductase subunit C/D
MSDIQSIASIVKSRFSDSVIIAEQSAVDGTPVLLIDKANIIKVLSCLKSQVPQPYRMLYDLTAIDERKREKREGQPASDFTIVYLLTSFERNEDIRIKVPLTGANLSIPSITKIWSSSNWYEREIYDMFGISFEGHPHLVRILMPRSWKGHPLRKEHHARATDVEPFTLDAIMREKDEADLKFNPEEWGMKRQSEDTDFMFLNIGPQHPGTHGILRLILQLEGEDIVDIVPDIGFHHRGAEKMGERQSWHTFIPYTDRIDYLSGVMNNLAYLLSVE